jgi:hypothetical protein
MLLAPDLDYHLLEARHDGSRAKVSKIGHPVASAQTQARGRASSWVGKL